MRDCFIPPRVRENCDHYNRYRSSSGACNNLKNKAWGSAGVELVRLLPPDYEVKKERIPQRKTGIYQQSYIVASLTTWHQRRQIIWSSSFILCWQTKHSIKVYVNIKQFRQSCLGITEVFVWDKSSLWTMELTNYTAIHVTAKPGAIDVRNTVYTCQPLGTLLS